MNKKKRKEKSLNRRFLIFLTIYGVLLIGITTLFEELPRITLPETLVILAIITIILVCIGYYYLRNSVTIPLQEISQSIKSSEDLTHLVNCQVDSPDELGKLSNSLNALFKRLNDQHTELMCLYKEEKRQQDVHKQMIHQLSHEMKTPLSVIQSSAQAIIDGLSRLSPSDRAKIMIDEVESLNNLLHELLRLAKHRTGVKEPHEPFDLVTLIQDELERLCSLEEYKNRNYRIEIQPKNWTISAHKPSIEKVLVNLISNANKYTKGDVIHITLVEKQGNVYFSIRNKSEYFSAEELEKIWQDFYRKEDDSSLIQGHGLGLSTVQQILSSHHFIHYARYHKNTEEFEVVVQFPCANTQ